MCIFLSAVLWDVGNVEFRRLSTVPARMEDKRPYDHDRGGHCGSAGYKEEPHHSGKDNGKFFFRKKNAQLG